MVGGIIMEPKGDIIEAAAAAAAVAAAAAA